MITISVLDDPVTAIVPVGGVTSTQFRASGIGMFTTLYTRCYVELHNPPVEYSTTIQGGYIRTSEVPYGDLRDKEVVHLNSSGKVTVQRYTCVDFGTGGGHAFKSGTTIYPYEIMVPFGSSQELVRNIPACNYEDGDYKYVQLAATYTRLTVQMVDGAIVKIWHYMQPETTKYDKTRKYYLPNIPASETSFTTIVKKVGTIWMRSNSSHQLSYRPTDSQVRGWLNTDTFNVSVSTLGNISLESRGTPSQLVAQIEHDLQDLDYSAVKSVIGTSPVDFGELAVEASSSLKYVEDNILLIVQDLFRLRELGLNILTLILSNEFKLAKMAAKLLAQGELNFRNFRLASEPFAKTFLTWRYAIAPNLNDLSKIGQGIATAMFEDKGQRVHSRRITSVPLSNGRIARHTSVFTAEVSQFGERDWGMFQEMIYLGKRWGMYPETQNLWDALAYSFVVDWFVQFGDLFEGVDAYLNQKNYFPVEYCIMSEKWEYVMAASDLVALPGTTGEVSVSYYTRWITEDVPLPSVSLTASTSLSNHWAESGALVSQRIPR